MIKTALPLAQATGRQNNLDVIRLMAAIGVVVSHAWPLALGDSAVQPLEALTGWPLGKWSVLVFFILSGFLITRSAMARQGRAAQFWLARANRLVPALALALVVTVILANLSGADASAKALGIYILRGITLVSLEHQISGAFEDNPVPFVVNGPLYTLFYEVACYVFAALLVWSLPAQVRAFALALCAVAALALYGVSSHIRVVVGTPLFLAFACGMLACFWQHRIALSLSGSVLAGLALALVFVLDVNPLLSLLPLTYLVLAAGLNTPHIPLPGDLSYGVYLYGWPVAQTLVHMGTFDDPVRLAICSVIATLPFAAVSWVAVEKRRLIGTASRARQGA